MVPLRRLLARLTAIAVAAAALESGDAIASREMMREKDSENEREGREDDLDGDAAVDPGPIEAEDAALALGRSLALALGEMRPLSATELAASWSVSPDPLRRHALGVALEWTFPLVGAALVIDHLARDPEPAIRAAAARAAWIRRPTGGDLGVLDRLAEDPDPQVRHIARAARSG